MLAIQRTHAIRRGARIVLFLTTLAASAAHAQQAEQQGVDERGRAVGHFMATGIRPTFMTRLESSGVRLPSSAFRERIMLKD